MQEEASRLAVFGTSELPANPTLYTAGPLSVEFDGGIARHLSWHGTELVRAIAYPIRDENWGTYPPDTDAQDGQTRDGSFSLERRFTVAGGALRGVVKFTGSAEGTFSASLELAAHRDFWTSRAGFTILHPAALAGSALVVLRPDGSAAPAEFPRLVSPGQVAFEIAGLTYAIGGIEAGIVFAGETFEMEDQRNWTDASYKTYCRSLLRPYPYVIRAGETVRQSIEVRMKGSPGPARALDTAFAGIALERAPGSERFPSAGLVLDADNLPTAGESAVAMLAGARTLRLRVRPETAAAVLSAARTLAAGADPEVELEIVIPRETPADDAVQAVAGNCRASPLRIARVIALPEAYLCNYQPTDPQPDGPTPREAALAARRGFPRAAIGAGMLTHFTEFNRCRPDAALCDYVTHGTSAIFHAADDRSVVETLEGLSHVLASARALAAGRPYHLGLVSIGMRTNPHGADVAANPGQIRLAAARADPRQRGLFAAAWAVGAMAATQSHGVSSIALAAPVGPLGIVYRKAEWAQPLYEGLVGAPVFPLFHVFRAFSQMAGEARFTVSGAPPGIAGVAAEMDSGVRLVLANLFPRAQEIALPAKSLVLDSRSFSNAIADPGWLRSAPAEARPPLVMEPFSIAFAALPS